MNTGVNEAGKKYLTVLADGRFHQTVPAGTEGAVVRTYEDKEGVEQSKTELVFDFVSGVITGMKFRDGDFGTSLQIELDGDGVVDFNTASNFGEDLMKKIPSIDLSQPVKIVPYAFEDDKKKSVKGVTVYQNGEKVYSYYYDTEKKEVKNGLPQPEGDTKTFKSDDWKMYFMVVRKFLVGEVQKIIDGLAQNTAEDAPAEAVSGEQDW